MNDLQVPMVALAAEVLCADGRRFSGRLFVSASASRHEGPMRAEEWINDPAPFFPFLVDAAERSVVFNKGQVLAISVAATADRGDIADGVEYVERRVVIECGENHFEGSLVIDMPQNQSRVLDYLNRDDGFLVLRAGERHHLVLKRCITRVIEVREE